MQPTVKIQQRPWSLLPGGQHYSNNLYLQLTSLPLSLCYQQWYSTGRREQKVFLLSNTVVAVFALELFFVYN